MQSFLAFVDDGFDESAYIAESPGLHPAVRFTYRPLIASERSAWFRDMDRKPDDRAQITADMLARKVQSWDLKDRSGAVAKIEPAQLLKLRPRLWDRMLAIVSGQDASDFDPQTGKASQLFDQEKAAGN